MRMFLLLVMIGLFASQSCSQKRSNASGLQADESLHFDTATTAIFKYGTDSKGPFDGNVKAADLSQRDLARLDSLLKVVILRFNTALDPVLLKSYGVDTLAYKYKRQFLPVLAENGEKIVWVNFLCQSHSIDWKEHIVDVADGGNCYFNMTINLTTGESSQVMVNGYGLNMRNSGELAINGESHQSNPSSTSFALQSANDKPDKRGAGPYFTQPFD